MTKKALLPLLFLLSFLLIPFTAADSTNLTPIETLYSYQGSSFNTRQVVAATQLLDNTNLYNGQSSIKLNSSLSTWGAGATELDGAYYPITAGDHIIFSAYIKVDDNTVQEPSWSGFTIGIDFYGTTITSTGRIGGVSSPTGAYPTYNNGVWSYPSDNAACFVHFNSGWTFVSMEFDVPIQLQYDGCGGIWSGTREVGEWCQVTGFIPASFMWNNQGETASAYIAEMTLTVNSNPEPTPAPTPTNAPTEIIHMAQLLQPSIERDSGLNPIYILLGLAGMGLILFQVVKEKK